MNEASRRRPGLLAASGNLLSWVGKKIGLTDGGFWAAYYGGDNWAGKPVNVDSALTVSAYWAGVRLISQTIGTLPLHLFERTGEDDRKRATDNPLYRILHNAPNAEQTAVEFWEGSVASLCMWGNAYARKMTNAGKITGLLRMSTTGTCPHRDKNGRLTYRYTDPANGQQIELQAKDVFHIRGWGDGDVGMSPLQFARQTLGMALATNEAAARNFSNGLRPGGFFTFEKLLSPEQRKQARETLVKPYEGTEGANKIGILEAGVKWQDVMMDHEKAQMLQTRGFNVEEVCRILGVPPILIGHSAAGQTMWGSGVEQILLGWLTLGLRPYLERIEQAIWRSLLSIEEKEKLYAEYSVEGLLRADSASRATFYSTLVQNGIMTRNEARRRENLPRVDGGDELTIQTALQPITNEGGVQPPQQLPDNTVQFPPERQRRA
jgi:HK97 family phage portal protein